MAKVCDLSGKKRLVGHLVSHSNIKTKMRQQVNLKSKRIFDPESGQTLRLRVAASTLRSLDKLGGIGAYVRKNARKILS